MPIAIVVHGGAGAWMRGPDRLRAAVAACHEAAATGLARLHDGAAALDAVEAAVRVLEDAPVLNAGRGSHPRSDGSVEMDAIVMDGSTLGLGAVACVRRVLHPVSLARLVLARSPHTLLVAHGAERFADEMGFPRCEEAELKVPEVGGESADTVGAVACDAAGHVAVAASTGGILRQWPGRVGDTPLVGAGAYADDASAAATATGEGEALMKLVISKLVCDLVAQGATPERACRLALDRLEARLGATGGVIAVDPRGRVGVACSSPAMPVAYAVGDGPIVSGMWPRDFMADRGRR
ncbi:MAG TPA: isoaspartyl peptidase/L-asparaginase [Dehalococcoidia bacterium]|nr:isoaspartyl peptidase/L-asparaginase [Dehalococcoidia bacterium]